MTTTATLGTAVSAARRAERSGHPVSAKMRDAFVYVSRGATVGDALEAVRRSPLGNGMAAVVFIVGTNGRYEGFVRLSALVRAEPTDPVAPLIEGADVAVRHDMEDERAARELQVRDLALLPVVNAQREMIGVLTFDDAMDILEIETSEDIYKKAGIGDLLHPTEVTRSEKLTAGPIWYSVRVRILFLLVTLAGGLIVGGLIDHFEDVLGAVIALAIFIPLVMDMGGNVGTQSTTIFARGYALGQIKMENFFRNHLAREALVGLAMAAVIAIVAGIIAFFWQGVPNGIPQLGVVVGVALFTSVFTAACLGFLLPWAMVKIGVDHAPGADPFITTIKDFTGLLVYFLMAAWLLGLDF